MSIKIGHASSDERKKSHSGKAGDQTGGEVCTRQWYSSPWNLVLRCKDPDKAEQMARACEAACANSMIGYDQYQRNTLLTQAKACNWDLSKISVACECDCSSLMTVCAQCAGIDVPYNSGNAPYTGIMRAKFMATGYFEALTESKYLSSDKYLKRGDILVKTSGHTAMALENGSLVPISAPVVTKPEPVANSKPETVVNNKPESVVISGRIDTVAEVQTWLNKTYSAGLATDNKYGPKTKTALVKALQKELGVAADGIYGARTEAAVKVLRRGKKGNLVKVLQGFLVCNGQAAAYVDGDFGSGTETAVKTIQRRFNLAVDGAAGKNTFKALCK